MGVRVLKNSKGQELIMTDAEVSLLYHRLQIEDIMQRLTEYVDNLKKDEDDLYLIDEDYIYACERLLEDKDLCTDIAEEIIMSNEYDFEDILHSYLTC